MRNDVELKTKFIDKFLLNLQKSSQMTVDLLLTLKNPEKIVTRWTDRAFNTTGQMNLLHPAQSMIDKVKELDCK